MKNKMLLILGIALLVFAAPQVANACSAEGFVFCDVDGDGTLDVEDFGLANITVVHKIDGLIVNSVETDSLGYFPAFWGDDCPPTNEVEVDIADPDLPAAAVPTTPTSIDFCNEHLTVYFGFASPECAPIYPVKTQGYWKHNLCYWAYPPNNPDSQGYQEDEGLLEDALELINGEGWDEVFGAPLTIESACDIFQAAESNNKCNKAKAQLLAVMLNVARGYVPEDASISSPDAETVGEAIELCIALIESGSNKDCTDAQSLADSINTGIALNGMMEIGSSSGGEPIESESGQKEQNPADSDGGAKNAEFKW